MWVRIPLEIYIFILNFSLPPRSEQVNGAVANEIKHVHSPEVMVVLDPIQVLSHIHFRILLKAVSHDATSLRRFSFMKLVSPCDRAKNVSQETFKSPVQLFLQ